jgi:hypothetical protein
MSAISSVSSTSGLVNLMQMLTNGAPPAVSSVLASQNVQAALAKASPTDIVQLSDQAMQLQMADGLFGGSNTSSQASLGPMTMVDLFASILSPPSSSADTVSQMESSNLAQQSVLAAVYTPSGYGASWDSSSASGSSGASINLLA